MKFNVLELNRRNKLAQTDSTSKKVIILGSSRSDGDAKALVNQLLNSTNWDLIDLNDYDFSYYDYKHRNRNDDYLDLMKRIIGKYDTLIFATPVYWYSMSGIMKVFFDRITDLLRTEKEVGRKLRGKSMAVITCSNGGNLGDAFWLPFKESANYLGMKYLGDTHTIAGENNEQLLNAFIEQIEKH